MRKSYQVIAPIKAGGRRITSGVFDVPEEIAAPLVRDGFLAELPANRDPGDEQPPVSRTPIQPGAASAEGLSADDGEEAGAPASSPEANSTPDAQTKAGEGETLPLVGTANALSIGVEVAAQPESAKLEGPAPAASVPPAKAARKGK